MTAVKLPGPDFTAAIAPRTLAELMAVALEMESEAAQRYAEFADAMETHNNVEVAALFRKMASIETGHVQAIMSEMGWREPPPSPEGRRSSTIVPRERARRRFACPGFR